MYITEPLVDFVEACAARKPTPGGGAASALVGALGASLGEMAAAFTDPAKAREPGLVEKGLGRLRQVRESLVPLIESDCEAYEKVRTVLKMPRDSTEQKKERSRLLQDALRRALDVPFQAARLSVEGLEILDQITGSLNANLVTDAADSALFLAACFKGAWFNVRVNLKFIKDEPFAHSIREEGQVLQSRAEALEAGILVKVEEVLAR